MIKAIIVDDEPYSCESLATLLEQYCPAVKIAAICHSGQEGLSAIEEQQPQIVFLDIEMPKMNGFEMLEKYRKLTLSSSLPPVMINMPSRPFASAHWIIF